MQSISLGKARSYLRHLSQSYHEQKTEQEQKQARLHDAKRQLHHVKAIEEDLDNNLESLDARLAATLQEEKRILEEQAQEELLSKEIREKLRHIDERLGGYLSTKHAKKAIHRHINKHKEKQQAQALKKDTSHEVKMRWGKPHERVKAIQAHLDRMKKEVQHLKKTHPDHERMKQVEQRMNDLKKQVAQFEKKIKK